MDPRTRLLLEAPIAPTLLKLAIPNVITTVVQASTGLIETYFIGKLGTDALAGVTGLVMTKLDGTARGGILVAIAAKHQLPVHFVGVGESIEDLAPFAAKDFANAIAGIEA